MSASSSIKLINTLEWSKQFNFQRRANLGNFQEPALTSANIILQTIVGPPFAWRWNRAVVGFITTAGQQDYTIFNYLASTAVKLGWYTVDDAGNSQVCTTAGTTGASAPSWNHTKGATTTDGTVVWTNLGSINYPLVQGNYSFEWIETVSVQTIIQGSPNWKELSSKLVLGLESGQARPQFVAAQSDDGLGNVTFRLMPTPDGSYPVAITIQQKPPLFTKTDQTWAPIPDEFARIYNWGFLAMMWLFADDPRFGTANAKFTSALLGANEGLTETQRNIFLNNWQAISGQSVDNANRLGQGTNARTT